MMAIDYTEEEVKDMKETFYFFDKDGSGLIPKEKVGTVMRFLGYNLRDAEIQKLMLEVNATKDRKINFLSFFKMMNMMRMNDSGHREIKGKWNHVNCRIYYRPYCDKTLSRIYF